MLTNIPVIPESAPFNSQQRAWLNGFFAAILSGQQPGAVAGNGTALLATPAPVAAPVEEEFPWHDSSLAMAERLALAEGRPLERQMMAAMAQLNCGACGYLCQTYSEAIARGEEKDLTKCSPGGSETAKALKQLLSIGGKNGTPFNGQAKPTNGTPAIAAEKYSRTNPFAARLISNERLTQLDAPKDTRHVVIDLLESGLEYQPGDSLGILPVNCPELVKEVLQQLAATGDEPIQNPAGETKRLADVLAQEVTLARSRPELLELLASHAKAPAEKDKLTAAVADGGSALLGCDIAELLAAFPSARPALAELVAALARLQPRLYSISSSPRPNPKQVTLTVGVVKYESQGRWKNGVASHFLGVRSLPGDEVRVFVQQSPKFRLPADPNTPVIMVGPGTGIAPFRAFIQERAARDVKGPAWLFFGNQHFEYDFLYREELSNWLDQGYLSRLDLAFSRDQAEKLYVQHKMLENAAELWQWLERGAQFYVCGDAKRMALDVDQALQSIAMSQGCKSAAEAKQYVAQMAKDKRYHKDVY